MPFEPGSGIRAGRERSAGIDAHVGPLVQRLPAGAAPVAVLALGSYGRRELTPRSDIDILVLHQGRLGAREATEAIFFPLWDQKLDLGHAVRSLAECASIARHDRDTATSFLDARLVAGDTGLFAEFGRRVAHPIRHDRKRLRRWLAADAAERHATHQAVTSTLAPDLKNGRGGLRDLHALRWLDPCEDPRLTEALDFLLRVRGAVQCLSGAGPERLSLDLHEPVAKALGYPNGVGGGDLLMRDLYGYARWIAFALDGALAEPRDGRRLRSGFGLHQGRLVGPDLPPVAQAPALGLQAANLVRVAPPGPELLAWAAEPGPPLSWAPEAREELLALLRTADRRAWEFLDVTGLVLRYLPQWSGIYRRRQHNAFHELAVDSHSFATVRHVHQWAEGGGPAAPPIAQHIWRTVRHRDWLSLAALLHDIGKGVEGDHAITGAALAGAVCERLELSHEARETIVFLIEHHLLLGDVAARRDIRDEDLLFELAGQIGSSVRLGLLYLLTLADGMATGRNAWSAWKAELVSDLFVRLARVLEQPADVGRRARRSLDHHRQQIAGELERGGMGGLKEAIPLLPRRYLLMRPAASAARHLALAAGPLAPGHVRTRASETRHAGVWELLVVARDRPGLLATVAGVLALRGVNILAADAATRADGVVMDAFTVASAFDAPLDPDAWPRIEDDLRAALNGHLTLDERLARRSARYDRAAPTDAPSVRIDNTSSPFYSLVEVHAPDRVGLLYRIAHALYALELDIHHAAIATHPAGVIDTFYVWDLAGEKLSDARAAAISDEVAALLAPPQLAQEACLGHGGHGDAPTRQERSTAHALADTRVGPVP